MTPAALRTAACVAPFGAMVWAIIVYTIWSVVQ